LAAGAEQYVALFRGINVGGRHPLPMRELTGILGELGLSAVRTYIQSGNVVFVGEVPDRQALARGISAGVEEAHGFAPAVLLLSAAEFAAAAAGNPYPEGESEPKSLHVGFLAAEPSPRLEMLEEYRGPRERYALLGRVFYLHAPDGIGRSRLATRIERALGVPTTMRNWRTVSRLLAMLEAPSS
jgi:uncharacterized protein (DUF1697 family)